MKRSNTLLPGLRHTISQSPEEGLMSTMDDDDYDAGFGRGFGDFGLHYVWHGRPPPPDFATPLLPSLHPCTHTDDSSHSPAVPPSQTPSEAKQSPWYNTHNAVIKSVFNAPHAPVLSRCVCCH